MKTSSTGSQYDGVLWIFSLSSLWLSERAVEIASSPVVLQFQSGSQPACSFRSFLLTVSCILSRMIVQRILLGTVRSMIPLQFLHSLRLPFLGIVTSIPVFHSVGISSLSQISFSTLYKTSVVAPISAFKTSDSILSIPGALPSFSFLMALLISSLDILPQLMLRSS